MSEIMALHNKDYSSIELYEKAIELGSELVKKNLGIYYDN